jgi:hypothetical protein
MLFPDSMSRNLVPRSRIVSRQMPPGSQTSQLVPCPAGGEEEWESSYAASLTGTQCGPSSAKNRAPKVHGLLRYAI